MDSKTVNLLKNLSTGLVLLAIVFAFMIAGIRLFGFQVYVVESGSMEPTYPVGSLIYVKSIDTNELRVNDAITYSNSPGVIVTHRIVDIVPDEQYPTIVRYQTKGDANREVDSALVSANNIIGKAIFSLPQLGHLAKYIQQPPGTYVAILVCGLMIAFVFYTDSLETKLKKAEEQQNQQQAQDPEPSGLKTWINGVSQKLLGKPLFKEKEPETPARSQGYMQQPMQYQAQQYPQQYSQQQYPQQGQYPNYPQQAPQQQIYQQNPYGAQQQYPQQGFSQSYPQQPYASQGYMPQQPNYPQQPQQNPYAAYPQQQAQPQQPVQQPQAQQPQQQARPQQYAAPQRYGQQLYMPQNGQQAPQQRNRRADRQ